MCDFFFASVARRRRSNGGRRGQSVSARVATRVADRQGVAVAPRRVPKNRRAPRRAPARLNADSAFVTKKRRSALRAPRRAERPRAFETRSERVDDAVRRRSSGAARARAGPRGQSGGSTKDEGACVASRRTSFACMGACAMVAPSQILGACVVSWDANVRVVGHARDARGREPWTRGGRPGGARGTLSRGRAARARRMAGGGRSDTTCSRGRSSYSRRVCKKKNTWQNLESRGDSLWANSHDGLRRDFRIFENVASARLARLAFLGELSASNARGEVPQSRVGRGSSARFTERGRRAWGAALAGRHGRVSPRRVLGEVRRRGARGARARVDRAGAGPESDERSLRGESPGGGGRGVGDARPGASARGRAVGHAHATSARQRDAPARARRALDAR